MDDGRVHDEPSEVEADGESVHLFGPSDVEVTMTPKAALETAKRLGDAAIDALLDKASNPAGTPEDTPKA